MSLMARIGRALVSRGTAEKTVPTSAPRTAPREVSRAETRRRISEGLQRRNAPVVREIDDVEAAALGILPNGELVDDVREEPQGVEVFGEPLPALPPPPAPLDAATLAAASVAPERAAAAAELAAKKQALEATARWKSPCKAIDAATGLQCGLMKGHTVLHRHARGVFVRTADGPVTRAVDAAAWNSTK